MKKKLLLKFILFFLISHNQVICKEFIILQSTTSARDSGLYDFILPNFFKKTQSTITGNIYSSGNSDAFFRIAKNSSNNNGYINGKISQVRVYDSVLTDAQIIDDYSTQDYLYILE